MENWWIIVGAIVAILIGISIIFIVKGGLLTGQKNINILSSCKNQGGTCTSNPGCDQGGTSFLGYGCPYDENGDGNIDENEKKNKNCCIPNERKS